jgi:hypothetical protein
LDRIFALRAFIAAAIVSVDVLWFVYDSRVKVGHRELCPRVTAPRRPCAVGVLVGGNRLASLGGPFIGSDLIVCTESHLPFQGAFVEWYHEFYSCAVKAVTFSTPCYETLWSANSSRCRLVQCLPLPT